MRLKFINKKEKLKMKNKFLLSIIASAMILGSCSDDYVFEPDYEVRLPIDKTISSTIDASVTYQTMDGFASSDAWTMDYIGKYWSSTVKEEMARLLFSQEMTNGQPDGIGLSMWRVNLGGGTAEQGDDSGIEDKVRRAECFLSQDGTYNWTKASGQQFFMEKAKNYGCDQFVFFSNTPPVYYTHNGKGYSNRGAWSNLKSENYSKFADYLATVAEYFQQRGYNISHISPVNEPQYNWAGGQEGSGWQNSEIATLARELDKSLTTKGLVNTKMLLSEVPSWDYLYETKEAGRSNVIADFFSSGSSNYIGNLSHMPKLICGHSYWTDKNWQSSEDIRKAVYNRAQQYGVDVYQTEWSMLDNGDGYDECPDYDEASYIDMSLAMSRIIYQDLAVANVRSWSYWTTAAQEVYSQKNRFYLIRIIPQDGDYGDIAKGGTYNANKNLWVLGNYSRFIRPGYQRIAIDIPEQSNKFFGVAFISPDKDKLVVVYTNISDKRIEIVNNFQGLGKEVVSFEQYTTSSAKDLRKESIRDKNVVPAKSVSTFVYELN